MDHPAGGIKRGRPSQDGGRRPLTRDRILWEALELFSRQGYGAVSVRDIARAVGIKESSLYSHFTGKREIFDALVDICWQKAKDYFHGSGLPFSGQEDLSVFYRQGGDLEEALLQTFGYFFQDPWNTRFRRLLAIERFHDAKAGELYRQLFCQYPMQVQAAIFAGLADAGLFCRRDPQALALEFYGGVYLLLDLCGSWEEAQPRLLAHIRLFREQQAL